ncbi:hypothetical protein [Nocardia sp. NPDC050793]|uniref:hypothetical protein n=1 Tax=Nocardia sp. NPDC050793 TaxID=3155159 RepID=UPI0033E9B6A9
MPAPTPVVALHTLTREQYARLEQRGLAGPLTAIPDSSVADRWRTDYLDWRGRYWAYVEGNHGILLLRPVNVARQSTQRAA